MRQQRVEDLSPDPAAMMRRGDSHLVDPELPGFVGVDVIEGRPHADDHTVLDGHDHVVARVREEFAREGRIDLVIKDVHGDVIEDGDVVAAEETNLDAHGIKRL
jgi:hypothetical protein